MSESDPPRGKPAGNNKRKRLLRMLGASFAALGVVYGAYWLLHGRFHEDTDDAYVAGNVVQITPQVAGTVVAIRADDTDFVKAGSPLVQLDPLDGKVALDQAEAQLAQTVREVRGLFANDASLAALVKQRETDLAKAREDAARRLDVAESGAVSQEEIAHAKAAMQAAEAALVSAREQLAASRALTDRTTVASHPNVARAAARVEESYIAYARATIPAPVTGFVAKRSVQAGQRVAPGMPLMAVIPLEQVWVDANFKEVQLKRMRIGQPATLSADLYGSRVTYHGKVIGLGVGTGAAFALLPPQNATGNWIKVVQRIPVRIALDAAELAKHPLRVGLSMLVDVNISDQDGPQLAEAPRREPVATTAVFADLGKAAQERVKAIIDANLRSDSPLAPVAKKPI